MAGGPPKPPTSSTGVGVSAVGGPQRGEAKGRALSITFSSGGDFPSGRVFRACPVFHLSPEWSSQDLACSFDWGGGAG